MKNVIILFLLAWICMATRCVDKESEYCHTLIKFSNKKEINLRVNYRFVHPNHFPDPSNIRNLYDTASKSIYKVHIGEKDNESAINSISCFERTFKIENYSDEVFIYVFDSEVVENTPWEVVARDYLVLKRYDLTLDDLQILDWKITYPPDERMKDMKMYPPYGQ